MATIKDIAAKTGLSINTVSRVMNNRGYISDETRRKVYEAMEELDYQPNEIARSLSRRKSNLLALIIPTIDNPFFAELANHIEYAAAKRGYKVLLCSSRMDNEKEKQFFDMLRSNQVDGVVMGSDTKNVEHYINKQYPIVTFDRLIRDIPYVACDNSQGGELAAEILMNRGCKKIVHISGDLGPDLHANLRSHIFMRTLHKNHIAPILLELGPDDDTLSPGGWLEQRFTNLLEVYPDVEGVFACNDMVALSVLRVCHQLGKRVPEDIKVVGYDDIKYASLSIPQLTTIKQPLPEMCELAVDLVVKRINGEVVDMQHLLPVTLVEREST